MSSIKVVSLNCGRGLKHLEATRKFLHECDADVICLQDVALRHIPEGVELGGPDTLLPVGFHSRHFYAMTNHIVKGGERTHVGVGIFSKYPMRSVTAEAYLGNLLPVLDLQGIDVDPVTGDTTNHRIAEVRATESRILLTAGIDVEGQVFHIGTTHGTWVKGGVADDVQLYSMAELSCIIKSYPSPLVMVGDFNPDKDGKVMSILTQLMVSRMPEEINNTLDPVNHALKGKFPVMADFFFTRKTEYAYTVSGVQVHFGVSDHGAISATVTRSND